ncbi:hypothetical protein F4818DRAFT_429536 [Hypoxylon cercidicola]|nr:hypothetical protein F4818DRAFT_429536 [Hypoxylon cercidicola]
MTAVKLHPGRRPWAHHWYHLERDVFLFAGQPPHGTRYQRESPQLKSVTIWDTRYEDYMREIPFRDTTHPIDSNGLWLGEYDAMKVCYWFKMMLDGSSSLQTINIYRSYGSVYEEMSSSLSPKMAVSRSSAVKNLFGDDTVYLVDLRNEADVNRVSSILCNEDSAKLAVEAMETIHRHVRRDEYLYYSELLEHLKFLWLDTAYKWNKERGLPARQVEQRYYWHKDKRVFACDNKNWSGDDPEIQLILEKMPKIALVYVLVALEHRKRVR